MFHGARVAVVVPAYNESMLIERTLRSIPSYVDAIVVVDDGSTDETASQARRIDDTRITVLRHARNRGVGAALATGYRAAFEAGADVAAVMAGDAQMDPADLASLLEPIVRGEADYAKGTRLRHARVRTAMPTTRYFGNHALSALTRAVTGLPISDSQCGYTALSRKGADRLALDALWPGYGYPNDLLARAAHAGLRVAEIVVKPIYADERSGIGLSHALFVIPYVLGRAWLRNRRCAAPRARLPESLPASEG